jgi:NitT/TauT family transport system permease protein
MAQADSKRLELLADVEELSAYQDAVEIPTFASTRSPRSSRVPKRLSPSYWLPAVLGIGLLVVLWQIIAEHNPYFIPSVSSIASNMLHNKMFYARNELVTLQEVGVGLSCSFVLAVLCAVVMSEVRFLERALMPIVVIVHLTPMVAIAPGLVVAFGFGMMPKYIVTAVIVFFPVVINTLIGLRSVDPQTLDLLKTLHASRREILWRARLPSSVPYLFAAARIAFPVGIIGAVVAEFSASGQARGLGSVIEIAASNVDLQQIYGAMVCLTTLGLVLTFIVVALEARVLANPLVYVTEGLRGGLTTTQHMHLYIVYPVLVGFVAVFLLLGVRGFRRRVLS